VRPTTLPPLLPLEHGAPSGDVNHGAFASKPFEVGEVRRSPSRSGMVGVNLGQNPMVGSMELTTFNHRTS